MKIRVQLVKRAEELFPLDWGRRLGGLSRRLTTTHQTLPSGEQLDDSSTSNF